MKYTEVLSPAQQPIMESFLRDFARCGTVAVEGKMKINVGDFMNEWSNKFKHSYDIREGLRQQKRRSLEKLKKVSN